MRFSEAITAIPERERLTDSIVYVPAKKKILAAALPGGFPKQSPRFPTVVLAALEDVVCDPSSVLCYRICGWWILVQCRGTSRFSDHRGLRPADVQLDSEGFVAKLTRSKTIGSDRTLTMRLVVISKGAFVQNASWMSTGWQLLAEEAAFDRDYLRPSPTDGFPSCRRQELRYILGSAEQFRVLSCLKVPALDASQRKKFLTFCGWGVGVPEGRQGSPREVVSQSQCTVILGWQGNGSPPRNSPSLKFPDRAAA